LLWALAASFPFVVRSVDSRFLYFCHPPLALLLALLAAACWRRGGRAVRIAAVALPFGLAALSAARVRDAVRAQGEQGEVCRRTLRTCERLGVGRLDSIAVDFVPPPLQNGFADMLELFLGRRVEVIDLFIVPRPPFLIYVNERFHGLAEDAPVLRFDAARGDYDLTTRAGLAAFGKLTPLLALRHEYVTVPDRDAALELIASGRVDLERRVVLLADPPGGLELGPGTDGGEVTIVAADTIHKLHLDVDARRDALLVISHIIDLTAAEVLADGERLPVLSANGVFNAVPLRKGRHRVLVRVF
jgi:hypothetical protein